MSRDESQRVKIRKEKLEEAIRLAGSAAKLSRLTGMSASEISQMRNPEHPRNVGDIAAERIESALGLPHGWMDVLYTVDPVMEVFYSCAAQLTAAGFDVTTEECKLKMNGKSFIFDMTASYREHTVYIRFGIVASIISTVEESVNEAVSHGIDAIMITIKESKNVASFVATHFIKQGFMVPSKLEETLSNLLSVATPTYLNTLQQIQNAYDAGVLDESDKAMLKIIADKYKQRIEEIKPIAKDDSYLRDKINE